jgi:cupin fold WbuC family metalloprotein
MKVFGEDLFTGLISSAASAQRRRKNANIHDLPTECVQRFFNALLPGSYVRPHRHISKWEFALILQGSVELLLFDDRGCVTMRQTFGGPHADAGFELEPGAWHSWVCNETAITLEIKPGPYDAQTAAEFALWAPAEGATEAEAFLHKMRIAREGSVIS